MDWIRENKTLATLMGVFLAAAAAVGFLVVKSYLALSDSKDRFVTANNSLAAMKSADLFPSPENLTKKKTAVDAYAEKVNTLSKVLLSLQPKSEPVSETDFQAKLKAKIAEVRALAGERTVLPADFALAFAEYTASLPKSAAIAQELADYLEATDAVIRTLITSGVESVITFERTPLAAEKGEAPPPPPDPKAKPGARPGAPGAKGPAAKGAPKEIAKMVEHRTLTTTLTADQGALQTVLNQLASPSKMPHFAAVRLLRVENEKNEGPLRATVALELSKQVQPAFDTEVPPEQVVIGADGQPVPAPQVPKPDVITVAKPGVKDAVGVLGQEKLKVYLEIDLIKFTNPEGDAPAAPGK
jgi:hypothetical protein